MQITSAVIFAGGKSSRMGKDKALLAYGKYDSMAEYQYRKLEKLFSQVYISAKSDKFDFDANVITDGYEASSPMVALVSVLEKLNESAVFVLSVDMPLVDASVVSQLLKQYEESTIKPDILIAKSKKGMEPLCAIYSQSILPKAKNLLRENVHRMHTLLDIAVVEVLFFDNQEKFTNINTPEDYNKSRK